MKTFQGARDLLAEGSSSAKEDFLSGLSIIFDAFSKALAAAGMTVERVVSA